MTPIFKILSPAYSQNSRTPKNKAIKLLQEFGAQRVLPESWKPRSRSLGIYRKREEYFGGVSSSKIKPKPNEDRTL